jgi:hypothetical protein
MLLMVACGGSKAPESGTLPGNNTVTVNPSSGTGADAVFSIAYSIAAGSPASELRILINTAVDGRNACYVYYDHASNAFALVKDEGSGTSSLPVGNSGVIENSQCSVDGAKSSIQVDANSAKAQVAVHFKPSFGGKKNIYAYGENASGSNTGLVPSGSWTVPGAESPGH